jgi:hypothetical protein
MNDDHRYHYRGWDSAVSVGLRNKATMMIDDHPPGLISRRAFPTNEGRVVVEEHWDISVPGCPMIRSPWYMPSAPGNEFIRQVIMTEAEYQAKLPPLFSHRRGS